MGRDAQIAFTAKPSWDGTVLGDTDPEPAQGTLALGTQPEYILRLPGRYYDEEYPRGPWPEYARILLGLFANLGITAVWYGHDCDFLKRIYPEDVLRISKYWMEHGWGKPQ